MGKGTDKSFIPWEKAVESLRACSIGTNIRSDIEGEFEKAWEAIRSDKPFSGGETAILGALFGIRGTLEGIHDTLRVIAERVKQEPQPRVRRRTPAAKPAPRQRKSRAKPPHVFTRGRKCDCCETVVVQGIFASSVEPDPQPYHRGVGFLCDNCKDKFDEEI